MERPYLHVAMTTEQSAKRAGKVCGDQVACHRTPAATTVIVCDGIGSGVRANLAARMTIARLTALLEAGFSFRKSFARTVKTVQRYKTRGTTYAAFTAASILPDGTATILGYEAPPPLVIGANGRTAVLAGRPEPLDSAIIDESTCQLAPGDGLLLVSDGVTQAGLGIGRPHGWPMNEVGSFAERQLALGCNQAELPQRIHRQAIAHWGQAHGDDCTCVLVQIKRGSTLTILTGPPGDPSLDGRIVAKLLASPGGKVVCGGTTATIVARESGRDLTVDTDQADPFTPPALQIDQIDLVTEGVITLTQAINLLDVDPERLPPITPAAQLCHHLHQADRVRIWLGSTRNANPDDELSMRRLGVLHREKIAERLASEMAKTGKLVTIEPI